MKETIKKILAWLIRLPPSGERKRGVLFRVFHPGISLENDIGYLYYLLFRLCVYSGLIFICVSVFDVYAKTGRLIKIPLYEHDHLILSVVVTKWMTWTCALLSIVFYLRIRMFFDLKEVSLPILIRRAALIGGMKASWIRRGYFCAALFLVVPFSDIAVRVFVTHYQVNESLHFIVFFQVLAIMGCSFLSALFVSTLLFIEKTKYFFEEMQRDVGDMGKDMWGQ